MEVDTTIVDLIEAANTLYGQMRILIFTKKKIRPKIQALRPTSSNLFVHVTRAHLHVMLWNWVGQQASPD